MIVQKYGGSSLSTIDKMRKIASKIIKSFEENGPLIVVLSAMGNATNDLIHMAKNASKNPSKRELDMLLATGEQVSTSLLSMMLNDANQKAVALNGLQAGIQTVGQFTKNKIKDIDLNRINHYLNNDTIVIITGFQGVNQLGDITTLGRGGSDTTAVALSAKYQCDCEIYTDVDGIYTMDPRRQTNAKKLPIISYEEMSELAYLGANIMEPRAVEIAQKYHVNVYVGSASQPHGGTWIKENPKMIEQKHITGLSVKDDIVMISLHKMANGQQNIASLFNALADNEINVDMISQTPLENNLYSLAFTAPIEDLNVIKTILKPFRSNHTIASIQIDTMLSKVSLVGIGMRSYSGIASKIFELLSNHAIDYKLTTTSDISISYTIPTTQTKLATQLLADAFNLGAKA